MPNIVFLVREFNDIDHMTPVIHRVSMDKSMHILVYCMNPRYDIRNDYLLNYLRDGRSCTVDYIYGALTPTIFHRMFYRLVCVLPFAYWLKFRPGLGNWIKSCAKKLHASQIRSRLYNPKWAQRMLAEHQTTLLVVDLVKLKQKHTYWELSQAASTLGVKILALNHATQLRDEQAYTRRADYDAACLSERYEWIDNFIVHSDNDKYRMVIGGIPENNITVAGSARYCSEWSQTLNTLIPRFESNGDDSRLKVLIIDGMPTDMDVPAAKSAALKIAGMKDVSLVVKGVPRGETGGVLQSLQDKIVLNTETLSLALIRWADVIIAAKSSVILEIYNQHKIFVFPRYWLFNRPMLFERFGACWPVTSENELVSVLEAIRDDDYTLPYGGVQISFLQDLMVYVGKKDSSVLDRYLSEFQRLCA